MEKIVIFGTGSGAEKVMKGINPVEYEIVGFIDNNKNMQGKLFYDLTIYGPDLLVNMLFDKIVICSTAFSIIKKQLIDDYNISVEKIVNKLYFVKNRLVKYYKSQQEKNLEIQQILSFLETNDLEVFNYEFRNKYISFDVDVHWDNDAKMYYVYHNNKKMYFKRSFKSRESVVEYYRFIRQEQDAHSPHRYFTENMMVTNGDVVIDAGVAEGNFALEVVDYVSKLFLIEVDKEWIEALKYTFKDYGDKVVFVDKYLSNLNDENNITMDYLIGKNKVNYIKMDIEGEEYNALQGAINILKTNNNIKLNICTYHNISDEESIEKYVSNYGYQIEMSKGYMFYIDDSIYENEFPHLVRGLLKAIK